jgi:Anaphase-promoting complex subunit 4 WD40 domain
MTNRTLKLPSSYGLCLSRSEKLVAIVGRNIVIADLVQRKRLGSWHLLKHPSSAAFSRDETLIAVKSTWGEIAIMRIDDGALVISKRPRHQDEGAALHFSPCNNFLVDGSWSGEIRVRNVHDLAIAEKFTYKNEMISSVSPNARADRWLFVHNPKCCEDTSKSQSPYLTIWTWPLKKPKAIIIPNLEQIYSASLAPSALYIAIVGYSLSSDTHVLQILSLAGKVLASVNFALGGTGYKTSWSRDSKIVGTVADGEFLIFEAPSLVPIASFADKYPSDMAFFNENTEVLFTSWTKGHIQSLSQTETKLLLKE